MRRLPGTVLTCVVVGNAPGFGEERVDRRPMVVTCFRVGAVVHAGGESKGIRRRDWPVVSCRTASGAMRRFSNLGDLAAEGLQG
jgi:hypothetical protein